MKKKIMIIMLSLLLVSVVVAVSVNQILTQEDINTINVTSFNLQEGFIRDSENKIISICKEKICSIDAKMLSADKEMLIREVLDSKTRKMINESYWSGDYIVVDRIREIRFRKQPWADIRDETNITYARQGLANWLKSKRDRLVAEERSYLESIQTNEGIDLSDILDDLE